jgi:hypothetical protein
MNDTNACYVMGAVVIGAMFGVLLLGAVLGSIAAAQMLLILGVPMIIPLAIFLVNQLS